MWHTYRLAACCGPVHALTLGVTLHAGLTADDLPWLSAKTTTELTDSHCAMNHLSNSYM